MSENKRLRNPSRVLDADQKAEIKEVFDIFDSDKSGSIDRHELKVGLRAMGFDVTKEEIAAIMSDKDPEGMGFLGPKEFEEVVTEKMLSRDPVDEIRRIFKLFDKDNMGKINISHLKRVLKELGSEMPPAEVQAMFDEFDSNGDGFITEEEFISMINEPYNEK